MDESNKTRIQEFYSTFQASRTDLSSRLEALKVNGSPSTDDLSALAADVAKLRKELTDATSFLPGYDQRQYELFLKGIENSLEELRVSFAPKPKFAFKRKTPKTVPASSTSSTPIASSAPSAKSPVTTEQTSSPHLLLSNRSYKYLDRTALADLESSSDLTISDLDHCVVNLLPSPSASVTAQTYKFTALHVRNLTNTVLVLPAIDGSALLHDLKRCTIVLGCHQVRPDPSST
ncbi:hypothetical protein EIP86_009404 [Pleurotus ostreatoroseus]|nr:hypothetical protein EIP86_009404 [Pleurotus ostreatoroseus]